MKQGIILGYLGKTQDRFSQYQEQRSVREMLEELVRIPGMDGVEMVYPYQTGDPEETNKWMKELGLKWAAINVNIKKEAALVPGALTRPDKKLRQQAIDMIKAGKDYAKAVGAPRVTCCPLADGYDYLFQVDYAAAWKNLVSSVAEAAAYLPEIPLHLEYKFSETRVRCTMDTAAKTLLLCREVDNPSLGVTLDFGHSMYGNENPAEALCMLAESGYPYYLHTNDNDGRFDWDLAGASYNFLHYAEFLFWAREYAYDGYFTTDASPRIFDMGEIFTYHSGVTEKIWDLVGSMDRTQIREMMGAEKTGELLQMVKEKIYRL